MSWLEALIMFLASTIGAGGATVTEQADRITPPDTTIAVESTLPTAPAELTGCDEMHWYRVEVGLPEIFDRIGYRESRCRNDVTSSTGCCVGWWQNYISSHLSAASAYRAPIIALCGVTTRAQILGNTPEQKWAQACVTLVVWTISGLSPWALTS